MLSGFDGWTLAGVAHKVTQALAVTEIVLPDLILLDLGLAGENFVQVIGWMKDQHPSPTIVVLSQNRWGDLRKRCLEAGADYFCNESNPTSLSDLLEELEPLQWKKGRYEFRTVSP
jgi:DNA-binding NarL/FixJ family response regulator